jgi:hypothetical protein
VKKKKKKRKKKKVSFALHQHRDKTGNVFGKLHPVRKKHQKESTQQAHDRTET